MSMKKLSMLVIALAFVSSPLLASSSDSRAIEDAAITAKVKAKLIADKEVSALNIHVETNDGVVNLSGNAKTSNEVTTAIELAAETEGVKDIDTSKLAVSDSKHPVLDSVITSKVKGAFIREKLFGSRAVDVMTIHVETKDGVVYLTGKVDSAKKAKTAAELAKLTNGVKEVKSSIVVSAS